MSAEYARVAAGTQDGLQILEWEPGYRTWNATACSLGGMRVTAVAPDAGPNGGFVVAAGASGVYRLDSRLTGAASLPGLPGEALCLVGDPLSRTVLAGTRPAGIWRWIGTSGWMRCECFAALVSARGLAAGNRGVTALVVTERWIGAVVGGFWARSRARSGNGCGRPRASASEPLGSDPGPAGTTEDLPSGPDRCWEQWRPLVDERETYSAVAGDDDLWVAAADGLWWAAGEETRFRKLDPPVGAGACRLVCGTPGGAVVVCESPQGEILFHVDSATGTWEVATGVAAAILRGRIAALAASGAHRGVVFLGTLLGDILASDDGGRTWRPILSGLPPICSLLAM